MVRFIDVETGIKAMCEIHQKVDDDIEYMLYNEINFCLDNLLEAQNNGNDIKKLKKEVLDLLNYYFKIYETTGFYYKM